jgi:hypothetical protein
MDVALATSPVKPMISLTLVPDAGEVTLHEMKSDGRSGLVMVLRPVGEESRCPACARASGRVHSRYKRRMADLPWEGIPVRIELRVRRFFCATDNCSQRIFTERLPNTVGRHGRRICRLTGVLDRIALALGGSAGARLAQQLGIEADGSTLLRGLRQRTTPFPSSSAGTSASGLGGATMKVPHNRNRRTFRRFRSGCSSDACRSRRWRNLSCSESTI